MTPLYDFPCEYCDGMVRETIVDREPIRHHRGIAILEQVPIGICDRCGAHYYAADVVHQAEQILSHPPTRTLQIPVERYRVAG